MQGPSMESPDLSINVQGLTGSFTISEQYYDDFKPIPAPSY